MNLEILIFQIFFFYFLGGLLMVQIIAGALKFELSVTYFLEYKHDV